jgi:hypothetical protein
LFQDMEGGGLRVLQGTSGENLEKKYKKKF